jgi:hypothetical protein
VIDALLYGFTVSNILLLRLSDFLLSIPGIYALFHDENVLVVVALPIPKLRPGGSWEEEKLANVSALELEALSKVKWRGLWIVDCGLWIVEAY